MFFAWNIFPQSLYTDGFFSPSNSDLFLCDQADLYQILGIVLASASTISFLGTQFQFLRHLVLVSQYLGTQYQFLRHLGIVLASCGCHDKVVQIGWLETTEMQCLIVPDARTPQSRCQLGHAFSEGSRVEWFFASSSFWWRWAILCLVSGLLQSLCQSSHGILSMHVLCAPMSSYVFVSPYPFSLLIRTPGMLNQGPPTPV